MGPDVERDAWLDTTHVVTGDDETRFISDKLPSYRAPARAPDQPPQVYAPPGATQTQIEGDRLYALSIYRGLVLADLTDPAAPRIAGSFAFSGSARDFSVDQGRVLLLVNDSRGAACATGECTARIGRVLSLDARAPGDPTLVSEQVVAGTIVSSRRIDDVLYVLSRDLETCPINADCFGTSDRGARLTGFTRDSAGALHMTGSLEFPAAAGEYVWGEQRLYASSRVPADGPSSALALQVIDVSSTAGVPRLAARIELESPPAAFIGQIHEGNGLLYFVDSAGVRVLGAPSSDELSLLGSLALADAFSVIQFDGQRAFAYRYGGTSLLTLDLSDPTQPAIGAELVLDSSIRYFTLLGDRALVFSDRSESETAVPGVDVRLLDTASVAAPRVLDTVPFGVGTSRLNGMPTAFDPAGYVAVPFEQVQNLAYYGAPVDECPEPARGLQIIGFGGDRLQLGAVAAQPDTDSALAIHAGQLLGMSHLSLQSYPLGDGALVPSLTAPSARIELTRATARLRVLGDVALRLGLDWSRNELSAELVPTSNLGTPLEPSSADDIPRLLGLGTRGCSEQRGWGTRALTQGNSAIIPRFHRLSEPNGELSGPFTLTLHGLDVANAAAIASTGDIQLEPLAPGEQFLGVLQTEHRVLVARGRDSAEYAGSPNADRGWYPYSAFPLYVGDPTSGAGSSTYLYQTTPRLAPPDARYAGAQIRYDVIDWSAPAGAQVTARVEVPEAWAVGGWGSVLEATTLDTPWGWSTELAPAGPAVVNGDVVVSQHSEPASDGRQRFFLDRLDVSDPSAPRWLPPVNIPGAALHFDSATGELVTLEYARFTEKASTEVPCESRGYQAYFDTTHSVCNVVRRLLNGLIVEGDRAVRKSQLLLDNDRRVAQIAVSGRDIYYVTEPLDIPAEPRESGANAELEVTLERIQLIGGQLQCAPSIDLTGQQRTLPHAWQQFAARDGRVYSVSGTELGVLDVTDDSPELVIHELSSWGCPILEAAGDAAYCAQGPAGVERIPLE